MVNVELTPTELVGTDGLVGSWAGSAGTLDLEADHAIDGTLPIADGFFHDDHPGWSLLDEVHVILSAEPGNELINVDLEAMPWRGLGGVLYTRL